MSLGVKLKEARKRLKMTQYDLAEGVKTKQGVISKIETKGSVPSLKRLLEISKVLKTPLSVLLEEDKVNIKYNL